MACDILIDGYNVIKNNPMYQFLEIRNLAVARDTLVHQLKNRYRHAPEQIIVVFDGNGSYEQVSHDDNIRVIFSRQGETADSVIQRLTAQARSCGRTVMLFSDDGEVKQAVSEQGGKYHTTAQLTNRLNAAPRDHEALVRYRQRMSRIYGLDPSYKAVDHEEEHIPPSHHKKKKRKSRRH